MATISTTTSEEFDKNVTKNDKLVLVDFWAAWCMPCKVMAPALEKMSDKMKDTLEIVKVNVDESEDNMRLAQQHSVQSIPNMQLFKNGEVIKTFIGVHPEQVLSEEIAKFA